MTTTLFRPPPPPPQNFTSDPYASGGLRVWDDYQFLRKGRRGGGAGAFVPDGGPGALLAPVNIVLPVVTGLEIQGQVLHSSFGAWTGTLPIGYTYQWYRVDSVPTNVGTPTISGSPTEGFTLTCSTGVWDGTPPFIFSYQWYREE